MFFADKISKQSRTEITFFDALIVLTSPAPYDLQTIGALHLQLGHGLKALDFLDRSLKLEPDHLPTLLNRAKSLFLLGYRRQALMLAEQLALCKDPAIADQAFALTQVHQM